MTGYQPATMPESDWKKFRKIHAAVLERFCEGMLTEIAQACAKPSESFHKRYLDVWGLIQDRNDEIANIFDELKRSQAIQLLAGMRARDLVTDVEYNEISEPTREKVDMFTAFYRGDRPPQ